MPSDVDAKRRAAKVVGQLRRHYADATCSLDFRTPLELLVATILSAQCTDERVNLVTKELFAKYPSAAHYAGASLAELERDIQSTGFFRNKAKSIRGCCQTLVEQYGGKVPKQSEKLTKLPGIGAKPPMWSWAPPSGLLPEWSWTLTWAGSAGGWDSPVRRTRRRLNGT